MLQFKHLLYPSYNKLFVFSIVLLAPLLLHGQWTSQVSNTTTDLFGLHFSDATNGWAVGHGGFITKSSDGGANWSSQTSGSIQTRDGVFMLDASTGFTVGDKAIICSTTDGGSTAWSVTQITGYSGVFMHDVYFPTSTVGYISANNGTVFKTVNAGTNWTDVSVPSTSSRYRGVYFVDASTGWLVGGGGNIVHTTNGGSSWLTQTSQSGTELHGVDFIDASTGWVVGSGGIIKKTTDGGVTWNPLISGVSSTLKAVDFIDADNGWAVGFGGVILRTEDGGSSWYQQPADVSVDLHDVQAFSDEVAIAVGVNGTVLKTTNGGGVLPVKLAYFKAKIIEEGSVLLNWQTWNELNNNGFEIQWSKTGLDWQKLAFVNGHGNTYHQIDYSFSHQSPTQGTNYYRLKQLDYDETFSFSVVEIVNIKQEEKQVHIYPNPVEKKEIFITLTGGETNAANYRLLSVDGVLFQQGSLMRTTQGSFRIALNNLKSGVYFFQILSGNTTMVERIILK